MAIATELVQQVTAIAEEHEATRIEGIVVECGVMRQVVPEALQLSFSLLVEGTIAEGAQLRLVEKEISAVCGQCESPYQPKLDNFMCPECGAADSRIVSGNEIILKSVICQTEDEVTTS